MFVCMHRDKADTYYCMLFNDEVHTYEQVIYTLQKAVNCSQKEAVSFATTVDREVSVTATQSSRHPVIQCMCFCMFVHSMSVCVQGRKSVRYGDFQFCEQAKSVIVVSCMCYSDVTSYPPAKRHPV